MSDLPREELMRRAAETLAVAPPGSYVHFKYTCPKCGERQVFAEPNVLYERGECHDCGTDAPVDEGGFMLLMKVAP